MEEREPVARMKASQAEAARLRPLGWIDGAEIARIEEYPASSRAHNLLKFEVEHSGKERVLVD